MNSLSGSDRIHLASKFIELTRSRRSIRGYLPERLDQATLDSIFETANAAPSNCNTQPWKTYVASGELRDRLSQRLLDTVGQGEHVLDFP
ncbi:MAG: nitroreductase family protein, partial [Planctomycetota bacterium]